jgi:uncharacterized protein YjbJ (UPF0337 family)
MAMGSIIMGSIMEKIKGRLKEAAGVLTNNDSLKRQGQRDQVMGGMQEKAERAEAEMQEKMKRAAAEMQEKVERMVEKIQDA